MPATIELREPELEEQVEVREFEPVLRTAPLVDYRPLFSESFLETPLPSEASPDLADRNLFTFQCFAVKNLLDRPSDVVPPAQNWIRRQFGGK